MSRPSDLAPATTSSTDRALLIEQADAETVARLAQPPDTVLLLDAAGVGAAHPRLVPESLRAIDLADDDLLRQYASAPDDMALMAAASGQVSGSHLTQAQQDAIDQADDDVRRVVSDGARVAP